jgi:hypothetical protein
MQEEYMKIKAEQKVETVKETLTDSWITFLKTLPQLPKSNAIDDPAEQIELV